MHFLFKVQKPINLIYAINGQNSNYLRSDTVLMRSVNTIVSWYGCVLNKSVQFVKLQRVHLFAWYVFIIVKKYSFYFKFF